MCSLCVWLCPPPLCFHCSFHYRDHYCKTVHFPVPVISSCYLIYRVLICNVLNFTVIMLFCSFPFVMHIQLSYCHMHVCHIYVSSNDYACVTLTSLYSIYMLHMHVCNIYVLFNGYVCVTLHLSVTIFHLHVMYSILLSFIHVSIPYMLRFGLIMYFWSLNLTTY